MTTPEERAESRRWLRSLLNREWPDDELRVVWAQAEDLTLLLDDLDAAEATNRDLVKQVERLEDDVADYVETLEQQNANWHKSNDAQAKEIERLRAGLAVALRDGVLSFETRRSVDAALSGASDSEPRYTLKEWQEYQNLQIMMAVHGPGGVNSSQSIAAELRDAWRAHDIWEGTGPT